MVAPAVTASKSSIRDDARRFASRYADARSEQSERQSFWNEFFAVFSIDRRQVAAFELLAQRASTGGQGWIDLLYPGQMGVEHKSADANLDEAMDQLVDYLPGLDAATHPWLLVACDFQRFQWRNLNDGTHGSFPLNELADNLDLFWWLSGYGAPHEQYTNLEDANIAATALLAKVHDRLLASRYPVGPLREWMTRILFCLFADDTGIWDRAAFHAFIAAHTRPDGSDLGQTLAVIFQVLNTPPSGRQQTLGEELDAFSYVNGDVFETTLPIPVCDAETRAALLDACTFNWAAISPAIFGSMFQNVMTAPERRQLGAHYTTEANILRTIRPLFIDRLEADLAAATSVPKLQAFLDRLPALTFFDPACGCGNFLVIAYREVRRLETEALRRLRDRKGGAGQLSVDITINCRVRVDQFYGIEVEEFPALIARTALYLMDHLANRDVSAEFGQHYVRFPIPAAPHIVHGNALRLSWDNVLPPERCDYLLGNPPFVGHSRTDDQQKRDKALVFSSPGAPSRWGRLDYVACWYVKAVDYLRGRSGRAAFVSTNSLVQGEQIRSMGPYLLDNGFQIDFAHRTFKWTSEARGRAHVHCVIIGFSHNSTRVKKRLFSYPDLAAEPTVHEVGNINPYLVHGPNVVVSKRTVPFLTGLPEATKGSQPTDEGHLLVTEEQYPEVSSDPVAAKYLRRYLQTTELMGGRPRWCLWLVDASPAELRGSRVIRDRLSRVARARRASRTPSVRAAADTPALFTQRRQPSARYAAMPEVSGDFRTYLPVALLDPHEAVAGNKLITWSGADMWLFGVLHSAMFNAWVRTVGGRMKSDPSLAPDLTYCTFPFVEPTVAQRARVTAAAEGVLAARGRHPEASLGDLYDPLTTPADLLAAHRTLDAAVDSWIGGRRRFDDDIDRLERLFSRYADLVSSGALSEGTEPPSGRRRRRRATLPAPGTVDGGSSIPSTS